MRVENDPKVEVVRKILDSNDRLAAGNQARLDDMNVFSLNLMASPGAISETSLICIKSAYFVRLNLLLDSITYAKG